jgi:hypothetical protein
MAATRTASPKEEAVSENPETGHDAFAEMAAPTEEHARLRPFEGTFAATVKMWMGPGEPQVMTGTMKNEFDLGGRFLKQTYIGDDLGGPFPSFEGRGFWGYNKVDQVWEGVWIDTASTVLQIERGSVDESGKVWEMRGEMTNPATGSPIAKRSVITLIDDDRHSMEMYFASPEGEMKGMEIQYERR